MTIVLTRGANQINPIPRQRWILLSRAIAGRSWELSSQGDSVNAGLWEVLSAVAAKLAVEARS